MGGGGAFRAAAKVAGVTVAGGGFRSATAEHHPVYRSIVRPASVAAANGGDVRSGGIAAEHGGDAAVIRKTSSQECDDWEFAGVDFDNGGPTPRVVFGGAPSIEEAEEATSDLKDALEKVYLSQSATEYGGSCTSQSSILSPFSKAYVVSDTVVTPSAPKHAIQAFKFLSETPAAQTVVASIASDANVWNAVLANPALQEFLESQKACHKCASFAGEDVKTAENSSDSDPIFPSSPMYADPNSEGVGESNPQNFFTGFFEDVKLTVVNMMNNLSDYFNNLFGGSRVSVEGDGSSKPSAIDMTVGASIMGLAVMAMMVVVLKRS